MDNLIKRLQNEAGLTQEQAIKSLSIVKDFMDKEDIKIDWEKFAKGKYENFTDKAKEMYDNISDKAEDLATEAQRKMRDLSHKASDMMHGDDDKK